jgi:heme oxygenase (biliverdin-producing, ferredoxin)
MIGRVSGFVDLVRERTRSVHVEAERTGIVADLLRGQASKTGYALLLRNLQPAYQALETALEVDRHPLAERALYRTQAIDADLRALGAGEMPELPVARAYAERIAGSGRLLTAHAYIRFMADLSGGRVLKRLVAKSLGLGPEALGYYEYPAIAEVESFQARYRNDIDAAAPQADHAVLLQEAVQAFRLNIALSSAVRDAAASRASE